MLILKWWSLLALICPAVGVPFLLIPESSYQEELFAAVTLSALSIGITARVLSEINILLQNNPWGCHAG